MKACPFCAEEIQDAAIVCRFCSADLVNRQPGAARAGSTTVVIQRKELSPGVAAVLSLIIPGAGQMYCGHVAEGLLWLLFVVIGYAMFILPGLALHVICIFGAITSATKANRTTTSTTTSATVAAPSTAAPEPWVSSRREVAIGRALAAIAHPRATFSGDNTSAKMIAILAYAVIAFLLLRNLWLGVLGKP